MNLARHAAMIGERWRWPDLMTRAAINIMVGKTDRGLSLAPSGATAAFASEMEKFPIALHTDAANAQHYELPPEFFRLVLGPHLKYSSGFFETNASGLAAGEEAALHRTVQNADLADGQDILELGCGWGSLSLWMASHFPGARITAVSNSSLQRSFIENEANLRGLENLHVITSDMNSFDIAQRFDRIISVEMFEHMSNWPALLARAHDWIKPDGRFLIHVFTHGTAPYRFDHTKPGDWIASHFFTGGIMPSHDLLHHCDRDFEVEAEWRWNGSHYSRTAELWLANFDRHGPEIDKILRDTYGKDAALWRRRWRLFFLATSGLFGYRQGQCWGVSQYRLKAREAPENIAPPSNRPQTLRQQQQHRR